MRDVILASMKSSVFFRWQGLAACLIFAAMVLPTLGFNRLMDVDELTHSRVALEAARDGHWLPLALVCEEARMGGEARGLTRAGLCLAMAAAVKSWFVLSFFPALALTLFFCRPWPFTLRQLFLKLCLPPMAVLGGWLALYTVVYGP